MIITEDEDMFEVEKIVRKEPNQSKGANQLERKCL